MEGYRQLCPLAMAAEIITVRWVPLILHEMLHGSVRFNDLHRGLPRMSRTLLSQRLGDLERSGLVERRIGARHPEYHLTTAGLELGPVIDQLGTWGRRWAGGAGRGPGIDPAGP